MVGARKAHDGIHDGVKACEEAAFRGCTKLPIRHIWYVPTDNRGSSFESIYLHSLLGWLEEMGVSQNP